MKKLILLLLNWYYRLKSRFTNTDFMIEDNLDFCKNCLHPFIKTKKYHYYCCDACRMSSHYKMRKAANK